MSRDFVIHALFDGCRLETVQSFVAMPALSTENTDDTSSPRFSLRGGETRRNPDHGRIFSNALSQDAALAKD